MGSKSSDAPAPDPRLVEAQIRSMGVQEAAIGPVLDGKNAVVLAPTAGGKTEAALFPLLATMDAEDWQAEYDQLRHEIDQYSTELAAKTHCVIFTKHAAVGLAEWLSVTYGDRGLHVACLCPQGVRTPLLFGASDSPTDGALAADVVKAQRILEPEEVADTVVEGLADERFLILPHPEVADYERARATDRDRWLGAMRRLQAKLLGR